MAFTPDELERYARHIMLKEVGGPGQQKLKVARVALIGAGGLGAPAALYLAAAGVGHLKIIDPDRVSLSNLQRQVLYRAGDIDEPKVNAAARALQALNPNVLIEIVDKSIDESNADSILQGSDIVLDGCDNFQTRFAVSDSCWRAGRVLVSGAVGRWDGQLSTFASQGAPTALPRSAPTDSDALIAAPSDDHVQPASQAHRSPCYRCLVTEAPDDAETCATVGVMGPLCGIIGSAMALEAIKLITGAGENLIGRLAVFDALAWRWRDVRLDPDPDCPACSEPRAV
ncbi:MAG: molybdopterin-synthase adenylyltransferase MoeB [Caulobacterales bacterium]